MNPGAMRHQVLLQSQAAGQSATGQQTGVWSTYATVFGHVKTLRGAEYYSQAGTQNEISVELTIHYREGIAAGHRAILGGVTYEIAAPPENVRMMNRHLLLRLRNVG